MNSGGTLAVLHDLYEQFLSFSPGGSMPAAVDLSGPGSSAPSARSRVLEIRFIPYNILPCVSRRFAGVFPSYSVARVSHKPRAPFPGGLGRRRGLAEEGRKVEELSEGWQKAFPKLQMAVPLGTCCPRQLQRSWKALGG